MHILICDDIEREANILKRMIEQILEDKNIKKGKVDIVLSGRRCVNMCENYDCIFLDIDMPKMDGIKTGEEIHKVNPDCMLVMATGREDRYREAYHIDAKDFIVKPFEKEDVEQALEQVSKRLIGIQHVTLYKERLTHTVQQKDISCIKAYDGYVQYFTKRDIYRKDIALKQALQELDERIFVMIRRSCVVNFMHVEKIKGSKIYIDDEILEISRQYKSEVKLKYQQYDLEYRG